MSNVPSNKENLSLNQDLYSSNESTPPPKSQNIILVNNMNSANKKAFMPIKNDEYLDDDDESGSSVGGGGGDGVDADDDDSGGSDGSGANDSDAENINAFDNTDMDTELPAGPSIDDNQDLNTETNIEATENDSDGELDINNLPETVSILHANDAKTIYLVGISHFSKQSHRDVRRVIRTVKPNVVVLELCSSRMAFISMDEKEILAESTSLSMNKMVDYIKKNGFSAAFIYYLMLITSVKVSKDLGLAPGLEFRNAFKEAIKIPGCTVCLGDRPINITFKRVIASLTTWQKIKIAYNCFFNFDKYNEEELEKLKNADILEKLIKELSNDYPGLCKVMVDERDQFLAYSLWTATLASAPGSSIVGVVGIGHSAGICNKWNNVQDIDINELVRVPEPKPSKLFFTIKVVLYSTVAYGVYRYVIPKTVKDWILKPFIGH